MTVQPVILRHATTADQDVLNDLAGLESMRLPAGPFLVAESDGGVRAALSLSDGTAMADPFRPTAELVELLRTHGAARERPGRVTRRRTRLAFGL